MTEQRTPEGWQKKKKYIVEYAKAKYKRIPLDVTWDFYNQVKKAADKEGETVNAWIKKAIENRLNNTEKVGEKPANFPKTIEEVEEAIKAEKDPNLMTDEEWNAIPDYIQELENPDEKSHALLLLAAKRRRQHKEQ